MTRLRVEPYHLQNARWPNAGRHILAQFDERSVVVYQAYRPEIGRYAAEHQRFGGAFSFNRMSWIKPNFLWMMYRSGWGAKADQETVLAIRLRRDAFDAILAQAVHSNYVHEIYGNPEAWRAAVGASDVRLQWDPDHAPAGEPTARRAIQLGMRGETLRNFGGDWLIEVEDVTSFVLEQAAHVGQELRSRLVTPTEHVYPVRDRQTARRLGVDLAGDPAGIRVVRSETL